MNDAHTEERQAWLRAGAPSPDPVPLCYRRQADGAPAFTYTPAAQQGPNYLRDKFAAMRLTATRVVSITRGKKR